MANFNFLDTRLRRLTAFFLLYMTEGIPNGFALIAIVTQMRRQGVSPEHIGMFMGAFTLPWAWKWAIGPVVDLFYSSRLGRRRVWIVAMQVMMCVTLLAALPVDFSTQIKLMTILIIIHNVFAATQDVAIDALACGTLKEDERGLANGLMFSGAYCGQAVGGAGVLYLLGQGVPLNVTFFFVIGCILVVTLVVSIHLREPLVNDAEAGDGPRLRAAVDDIRTYGRQAIKAFFGTREAVIGLIVAVLPMGAYALSLALQSNLAVELGLSDTSIANLALITAVISAGGCVLGGYLSDKFGRRRMLVLYVIGTVIPTVYLAFVMYQQKWIMPIDMKMPNRPVPADTIIYAFWTANIVFSVFQGLYYGTRTALFMDICTPAVAATQFTAYMALLNFVISYSAFWQGKCITALGYPLTLMIDAAFGLVCIIFLPFMKHTPSTPPA